jgi:hypothetical protein
MTLPTTSTSFNLSPFYISYILTRNDRGGDIPCTESYTFFIADPNAAPLHSLTVDSGKWETVCSTEWKCGGLDPSMNAWTDCQDPSFQFMKTLPDPGSDQLSNFVFSLKRKLPLLRAAGVGKRKAREYSQTNPEDAEGLDILLTLEDSVWRNGGKISSLTSGGIDQTGNCRMGCEYSGDQISVDVVDAHII